MSRSYFTKKIWFVSVLLITILSLAACGSASSPNEQGTNQADQVGKVEDKQEKTTTLTFSHYLPGNHLYNLEVVEPFAKELEEATNGRVVTEIYPGEALGSASSQYDMAVTGVADISLAPHGFTPGVFPLVSVVELPFFTNSAENGSIILWTLYEEFPEIQQEHASTTPLAIYTAEPAQIVSASKPIEKPEDLKGLRVRAPSPLATEILEELGAVPVSMPIGDVYEGLQRGIIDAAIATYDVVNSYSLHEVIDYITVGYFSMTPFFTTMNTDTFESLSEADQEALKSLSGMEMAKKSGRTFDGAGQKGIEAAKQSNVTFIELSGDQQKLWEEALEPVAEKWIMDMENKGYPGREIYERAVELGKELTK